MNVLLWIITGIVAGWLTGKAVKGRGYGIVGDLVVGLLGGLVGGWLFGRFGFAATGLLSQILLSFAGGVVLVIIVRTLRSA